MWIDAHHHLWSYDRAEDGWIDGASVLARDYLGGDYEAAVARHGIETGIVVQSRQSEAHTAWLCAQARSSGRIGAVVGWLDLRSPDIARRLAAWRSTPELVGVRHPVQDERDPGFLLRDDFVSGVAATLRAGLSYDILVHAHQAADVARFVDRLPPGRLILDHGAKPDIAGEGWQPWADAIAAIARHPNVWCKLSGLVTQDRRGGWAAYRIEWYMRHLMDHFGPDRLIFGSDWPVCLLAAPYGHVFELAADFVSRHCPEHHDAIFRDNARRAYGLAR